MSQTPQLPRAPKPPAEVPAPLPSASTPRRAFLLGGLVGGAAGLASGTAYGLTKRHESAPEPAPDEDDIERKAAAVTSYAQFGEDLVLKGLFDYLGTPSPSYLDIGTFEPVRLSNTYLFYGRNRGVLIEPNVDLSDKIRRLRPNDTLVVAGIGVDEKTEADYYVMTTPGINTFDKEQVAQVERASQERLVRVVKMPLISINRVMVEHFGAATPDLISIDIEGFDYPVLKSLDMTRFRPKVICVETVIFGTFQHSSDTAKLMAERGYELRGLTHANAIFVDKKLLK
jgi:FkbM family methyltransferase